LKQTRITAKISKQRPHQFTHAMNISKSTARASRSTVTLIKIKTKIIKQIQLETWKQEEEVTRKEEGEGSGGAEPRDKENE